LRRCVCCVLAVARVTSRAISQSHSPQPPDSQPTNAGAGKKEFERAGLALFRMLPSVQSLDGLYCNALTLEPLGCQMQDYNVGGGADSTYEYMLKQWLLSNKTDQVVAADLPPIDLPPPLDCPLLFGK
jgi:hypothetical protein